MAKRAKAAPKKKAKTSLPRPKRPVPTPKTKMKVKRAKKDAHPVPRLQPHIARVMRLDQQSGSKKAVTELSNNEVTPNKPMNKKARPARYGTKAGRAGPNADFAAPIVRDQPIGVTGYKQFMLNSRTNKVPDEFGVVSSRTIPMQQLAPARGGKNSGRTGPMN